jgi:DNA-binding NtrC family response regulator
MNPEICIVDDEAGIANMCKDYLDQDYSVRVFTSPKEALAAFEGDYSPDVLITDIKMPELDGFSMAKKIHQKVPDVPVVMMSGYADKKHVLEAMENEASGFLEKPFDPRKMKDLISSVVKKTRHNHTLDKLVRLYNEVVRIALDLNEKYIDRYTRAENRLHDASVALTPGPSETKAYLASIQTENQLHRQLDKSIEEIADVLRESPDVAAELRPLINRSNS